MWPKYVVKDEFLYRRHLHTIKNIDFDTKPNEWDIYKHKIFNDGKIEIGFQSSSLDFRSIYLPAKIYQCHVIKPQTD